MEQVQEQKFRCKYCSKCCFSGKSLGGHMKGHLSLISDARRGKLKSGTQLSFEDDDLDEIDHGLEVNFKISSRAAGEQSNSSIKSEKVENRRILGLPSDDQDPEQVQEIYCLRGNPKKSMKASALKNIWVPTRGKICKECGKKFSSSRALAGHMRSHSLKQRDQHLCKKCGKGFDSVRAMYGHLKLHTKRSRDCSESADGFLDFYTVCPRKKRSFIRNKCGQSFFISSFPSGLLSEEVEHAAMALMMLSMGVRNLDGFTSPVEDAAGIAHSVDREAPINDQEMMIVSGDGTDCDDLSKADQTEKHMEELEICYSGSIDSFSEQEESDNDMGSESIGVLDAEAESDGSIEDSPCCNKSKKNSVEASSELELIKDEMLEVGTGQKDLQLANSDQSKQVKSDAVEPEMEGNSSEVGKWDETASEILKDSKKKRVYKCSSCNKIFSSHQALGGHRNRSKLLGTCSSTSNAETGQLSESRCIGTLADAGSDHAEIEISVSESNKIKEHECGICFKVFPTGQALGGHKRAHYSGSSTESTTKKSKVGNQELHSLQNVYGMNNVPLIGHKVLGDNIGSKPWLIVNGHRGTNSLLISN